MMAEGGDAHTMHESQAPLLSPVRGITATELIPHPGACGR